MDEQQEAPKFGIIDSLSFGFQLIARRPWLLVLPVLLDLLLWLGPRITVGPLVSRFLPLLQIPAGMPEDVGELVLVYRDMLEQMGEQWNLLSLLVRGVVSLPSFIASQINPSSPLGSPASLGLSSLGGTLGWGALAALVGTLLGGLYLVLIARQLRRLRPDPELQADPTAVQRSFPQRLGLILLRLLFFSLLVFVGLLVIIVPISLLGGGLGLISPNLAFSVMGLLSMLGGSLVLWIGFILYFAVEAIVLDEVRVVQAVWRSANVVWRNLWPTLGLALLSYVIGAGFTLIWDRIGGTTWGAALSILGTAYIGAAISAAGLAFYADRRHRWQESVTPGAV